jgi:hypothetical protein
MNTHIKTLLNSSGIAKRNASIPLAGACKVNGNARIPQLISPTNKDLRTINLQTFGQKLMRLFTLCAFPLNQYPASMRPF